MGVHGLWQILEPTATPVVLESFEGKRIAVDISLWLHQALQGFNQYGGETRSPHLVLLINRIAKLLFYKIRPVFVFDGDQIPVFKRHILRDRELRRATDQLIVNKQQKRALLEVAAGSQNVGETLKKKARIEDNDLFALPDDIPSLPDHQPSTSNSNYSDDKFLAGYHNLVSRDDKINFLAEAKQKVKKTRLNDGDIPADADDFSKFQTERLLQRHQINNEIDLLRSEKAHQTAKLKDNQIKMVVVDAHARSHLLTKDHDSDIEIISPEKKKTGKIPWTEFVKQYRKQYDNKPGGSSPSKPSSSSATQRRSNSSNEPVDEMLDEESEEAEDDDVAETFLSMEEESARLRGNVGGIFQVGHIPSKTGAIDAFIGKMNALKKKGENFSTATKVASDDDSDFEDVPILAPKAASSRKLTLNQMTKAKPADEPEILTVDSEDEGDIEFAGRKTGNEDFYDREDEKGLYTECQQLLTFLGLPYIVAPGEAEAQCAELERLGLVEGIVTDDSDIWLFGGKNVYKNMFSTKRNVHSYSGNAIESQLKLTKFECIQLTMLAGGDYTRGFDGVGMVTALEIIAEFTPKIMKITTAKEAYDVLEAIRKWLDSKREFEGNPNFSRTKPFTESKVRIRLRRAIEKNNDEEKIEAFPNKDVFDAYCHPVVNSTDTSFKWKGVEFTNLEDFIWTTIGWSLEELHRKTHKAFTIWDEFINQSTQTYQTRISGFVQKLHKSPDEQLLAPTSRVQAALKKLFKTKGINPDEIDKIPITKPKKNPLCLPSPSIPKSLPPRQSQVVDDFFDESLDDEVFRLIEEKKKKENEEQSIITNSSSAAASTSKKRRLVKPKLNIPKSKKVATKKPKIPPATLQPSELNLSEEDSSEDD